MSIMDNVQPAVKKETGKVAAITGIGLILMWIVFGVLHAFMPQKVPFDYTVFLAGIGGFIFAAGNFFLMGLTVQKVAAETDEGRARQRMQVSQRQRTLLMLAWGVVALAAPCFNGAAGIIPLLFPSMVIKIYYLTIGKAKLAQEKKDSQSADPTAGKGSEQ